jgi:F0F1-type ATP synthase gamma subunit
MNRVRDDMSFLTIEDLMALTNRVRRFVNRLGSDILERNEALDKRHEKSVQVFNRIQKKYSLRNRAKCFLVDKFLKNSNPQFPEVKAIEQQEEEGIRHVLNLVEWEYQVTGEQELIQVLEQCAANTLGRIYGETYASYVLSRRTSPQLERFFKPYLSGI